MKNIRIEIYCGTLPGRGNIVYKFTIPCTEIQYGKVFFVKIGNNQFSEEFAQNFPYTVFGNKIFF